MKKVRKVCSKLLVLILAYIIICSVPVQAGENDWITSAKEVRFNTITRGTARNNMNPTLMDPWRSFGENYYFSVPVKMNITIILSIQGNQSVY